MIQKNDGRLQQGLHERSRSFQIVSYPKQTAPIIKLNAAMVPKRTKVFICKSPFSFASGVADARSKNTLQDELFPNDAVQKRNPYKVMLAAHTSKTFHSQGQG
jgi:hypothetical protein